MLKLFNDALASGSDQTSARTCQAIVQFLESGVRVKADSKSSSGLALGVSEADLQCGHNDALVEEFILEELGN